MSQTFTRPMARNVFYVGTVSFLLLFLALTFDTFSALPERHQLDLSREVGQRIAHGKDLW